MPRDNKPRPAAHPRPSNVLSLLTGWVQQGVESFFATQRVLVDVAMRQNAVAMKTLREGMSDPENSPLAILAELAVEGTSSFVEAQRILLNMAQQENEIIMNGVKERVAGNMPMTAMSDLLRRSIGTFIHMHEDFLKITSKQTINWLEDLKAGKGFQSTHLVEFAREGMDNFVQAQKKFLDVVAQETAKVTSAKPEVMKHVKPTEMSKLAREATDAFIEAQKRLLDVVGQQMNVNLKAATKTFKMLAPSRLLPIANLTGEGVKSFVNAEKSLIESMIKPHNGKVVSMGERRKRPVRHRAEKAQMAHAGA
ncbi:MAG: hypothetical protein LAO06_20980 [Acidobacteriia bacterium]|nr:hypothetical protein [Terriglobia bacterium]